MANMLESLEMKQTLYKNRSQKVKIRQKKKRLAIQVWIQSFIAGEHQYLLQFFKIEKFETNKLEPRSIKDYYKLLEI